jgi:predicted nucleic acid-binding protein
VRAKKLNEFLARHGKIGIDTSVFIYWVESSETYGELVQPIFVWLEDRGRAVTSTVTMLALLVQPYRLNDIDRVNQLYSLFSTLPNLDWIEPSLELADRAAHLRSVFHLKAPDALQAATALATQATGLVSNDAAFKRVKGLEVLVLDDVL